MPNSFMCFEDGVYELTVCDYESIDSYDDWSMDICVSSGMGMVECAYLSAWDMTYTDGYGFSSYVFTVNTMIGCMDQEALNFNPYS